MGDLDYAFHGGDAAVMGTVQVNQSQDQSEGDPTQGKVDMEQKPANFTICAPQLLHLDVTGRPFWFNGWLLPNKFSEDGQNPDFEAFIDEPKDVPGPWKLGEHNSCCLTSDHVLNFTHSEKDILERMIVTAKDVGAISTR